MRKIIVLLAMLLLGGTQAHAQATVEQCFRTTPTGFCQAVNATNPLPVSATLSASTVAATQGNSGSNAQAWWVQIGDGTNGPVNLLTTLADGVTATNKLGVWNQNYLYNGTTSSIQRDVPGASLDTGFGVASVHTRPNSSANIAIAPTVTAAAANNLVLKASAGNLYSTYATNLTATAGFLVVLNAIAAPADGAIAPLACVPLPANGTASISYDIPARYATGITAVVTSAATCFTKTTGVVTAFISGSTK